jgi:hypothetical protein
MRGSLRMLAGEGAAALADLSCLVQMFAERRAQLPAPPSAELANRAYYCRARVLQQMGRFREAIDDYDKVPCPWSHCLPSAPAVVTAPAPAGPPARLR